MASRSTAPPASLWLWHPAVDLLVGCGAWSLPILALVYASTQFSSTAWAVAFYQLALVANHPHYMATIYRAYRRPDDTWHYRRVTVHATAALGVLALVAHVRFDVVPWLVTAYVTWSPWHYTAQNFGLLMMFARRGGLEPSAGARRALFTAFVASYLMLAVGFNTGTRSDPLVLSLELSSTVRDLAMLLFGSKAVAAAVGGVRALRRKSRSWWTMAPVATLLVTQCLWFVIPSGLEWMLGWRVPQTRYSSGALAVLHSAQYLWVTAYHARQEAAANGATAFAWSPWRYALTLVVGGIALFVPVPWIASTIFQRDFAVSVLVVTAIVNLHHFILDGAVWKLRDHRVASRLLAAARERLVPESNAGVALERAHGADGAWARRPIRVAFALALVALAAVDQTRYVLASDTRRLEMMWAARALNPHDSGIESRVARAAATAGDDVVAIAALRRATALSPGNPGPSQALGRLFVERGRWTEARAHYEAMVQAFPDDADAWVNLGLLARRAGEVAAAEHAWQRALLVDPARFRVHLHLADIFAERGLDREALHAYRAYLEHARAHPSRVDARELVRALVAFGDALQATGEAGLARLQYETAERVAGSTRQPDVRLEAALRLTALLDAQGDRAAAYARLRENLSRGDGAPATTQALAWARLGGWLVRDGGQPDLAQACYRKALELAPESGEAAAWAVHVDRLSRTTALLDERALAAVLAELSTVQGESDRSPHQH